MFFKNINTTLKTFNIYFTLARLDKPIGWWLLLLPNWWIICIFENNFKSLIYYLTIFLFGAITMRSAGCIVNDIWDRNIDKKVKRTSDRPLASEKIKVSKAIFFLIILCFIGLIILIQLPILTWLVGLCSIPLILFYPLFKRFTHYPQVILGLTFSWGIPLSASVFFQSLVNKSFDGIVYLYIGTFFWVIGYDTIYAIQDVKDDIKNNIGSLAIKLYKNLKFSLVLMYMLSAIFWFLGFKIYLGYGYWIYFLLVVICHLIWQVYKIDLKKPHNTEAIFKSNRDVGLILTIGIISNNYLFYF